MKKTNFKLIDIKTYKKLAWAISWSHKSRNVLSWIDFEELRPYVLWDDIKKIDWLTAAKTWKIYVKKYIEEKSPKIYFFTNLRSSMFFGSSGISKLDIAKEIFLILWLSSVRSGAKVGFESYGYNNNILLEPKSSNINIAFALDFLSNISINNSDNIFWIDKILQKLYSNNIKNSIIFILTDEIEIGEIKSLSALSKANDLIFINIFDKFELWELDIDENIVSWKSSIKLFSSKNKNLKLKEEVEKILTDFKKNMISSRVSYLKISTWDNVYKELYSFFTNRIKYY